MPWRTRDEVVAAINRGETVSYGCGCAGVPIRTFGRGDAPAVPSQAQMTADEATCQNASSGSSVVTVATMSAAIAALPGPPVTSVAGRTGAVTLAPGDTGAQPAGSYATTAALAAVSAAIPSAVGLPLYCSDGTTASVGPSSAQRSSMLPPPASGTSMLVKANTLKPGCWIEVEGEGAVSATTVAINSTFTLTPHVTPAGGSKADLTPTDAGLTIGMAANCNIRLILTQMAGGLCVSGVVVYGVSNQQPYSYPLNPNAAVIASDYTVDRTVGIDGKWSSANAANYCISRTVRAKLFRPV